MEIYGGWNPINNAPVGPLIDVWKDRGNGLGMRVTDVVRHPNGDWESYSTGKISHLVSGLFTCWRYPPSPPVPGITSAEHVLKQTPYRSEETEIERVVCAVNRLPDGTMILGVRHGCSVMQETARIMGVSLKGAEQGFVNNYRKFLTREEAWVVAVKAGQIFRQCGGESLDDGHLFSDNLY